MRRSASILISSSVLLLACGNPDQTAISSPNIEAARGGEPLFVLVQSPHLTAQELARLENFRSMPWSIEVHVGVLTADPTALLQQVRSAVIINVSPTRSFSLLRRDVDTRGPDYLIWRGTSQDGAAEATLVLGARTVVGTLQTPNQLYQIWPIGGDFHAIVSIDEARMPPEAPPLHGSGTKTP